MLSDGNPKSDSSVWVNPLVLVALIMGFIVAVWVKGGKKVKGITIARLVKMECASITSTNHSGEFDIEIGELSQDIKDILTEGFTLEMVSAKVKWKKRGKKCVYTIEAKLDKDGTEITDSSQEFTVEGTCG